MLRGFLILIFLIACTLSKAQDKMVYPRWRIGVTPTTLVNTYPSIQLSLDRRLNERINLGIEGGRIFDYTSSARGFIVKPSIKLLLARWKNFSYEFGVHMSYRETIGEQVRQVIVGRARNGEFNYVNFLDVETLLVGIDLSNSFLIKLTRRVFVESTVGVGRGRKTIFIPGEDIPSFANVGSMPLTATTPIVYAQVNFSYAISL